MPRLCSGWNVKAGALKGGQVETAEAGGRSLSAAECDLRLIIDTVSGQYWVKG